MKTICVAALCAAVLGPVSARADVTFADSDFPAANWRVATAQSGPTVDKHDAFATYQVAEGNPGPSQRTDLTEDCALSSSDCLAHRAHTILTAVTLDGAVYDPSVSGPIAAIRYSFGQYALNANVNYFEANAVLAVVQNGIVFTAINVSVSPSSSGWSTSSSSAASFVNIVPGAFPRSPDFSANGGPIQFGYSVFAVFINNSPGYPLFTTASVLVDNFSVTVHPVPPDQPPTAVVAPSYSVVERQSVTLDGSGSYDDNTPSGSLGYAWAVTASPAGSSGGALVNANTSTPAFTPDVPGAFTLQLTVTDSIGQTSSASTTVSSVNLPPVAIVGPGQAAYVDELVTLDGSASNDPDGDSFTLAWTLTGPGGEDESARLSSATALAPSFSPGAPGAWVASLTATDQWGLASAPAQVTVSVITADQYAQSVVGSAINQIAALPPGAVKTTGNQQALQNLLHQAVAALQGSAPNGALAIAKLQQALARTDGWALRGAADGQGPGMDWVTAQAASIALYDELSAALTALQTP